VRSAWHHVEQYANNPIEADHGRLKHRLRHLRGLCTDRSANNATAPVQVLSLIRGSVTWSIESRLWPCITTLEDSWLRLRPDTDSTLPPAPPTSDSSSDINGGG
jgi:DDE superfamily endonuclease